MKKTDRPKDWPLVNALAIQAYYAGDARAVLHLRDPDILRRPGGMPPLRIVNVPFASGRCSAFSIEWTIFGLNDCCSSRGCSGSASIGNDTSSINGPGRTSPGPGNRIAWANGRLPSRSCSSTTGSAMPSADTACPPHQSTAPTRDGPSTTAVESGPGRSWRRRPMKWRRWPCRWPPFFHDERPFHDTRANHDCGGFRPSYRSGASGAVLRAASIAAEREP